MSAFREVSVAGVAALESAINGWLRLDPEALRRLARLHGKVIAIELRTAQADAAEVLARIHVLPGAAGVRLLGGYEGTPDTVLRGTPLALARLAWAGDDVQTLSSGAVRVEGDLEVGHAFKRALDGIRVDWEEGLSRLIGDMAAHRAGQAARGTREWGRQSAGAVRETIGEYLQEELRLRPARAELEAWLAAVDTVRDDCERLAARVRRLQQRLARVPDTAAATPKNP